MRRRLDGVDVVVVGARMVGVAGQDLLQIADDLRGPGLFRPVAGPVIPGVQVHEAFHVEGQDVVVVGEARGDLLHRGRVGGVERVLPLGIGGRRVAIALRHRVDQGALHVARSRLERDRLLGGVEGGARALRDSGQVDVGPEAEGHAPGAHRACRIQPRGLLERALRLFQVEAPHEAHALVEVALRLR